MGNCCGKDLPEEDLGRSAPEKLDPAKAASYKTAATRKEDPPTVRETSDPLPPAPATAYGLEQFEILGDSSIGCYWVSAECSNTAAKFSFSSGDLEHTVDRFVWRISFCSSGYLLGDAAALQDEGGEQSCIAQRMFGTITPEGQISLIITPVEQLVGQSMRVTHCAGRLIPVEPGAESGGERAIGWVMEMQTHSLVGTGSMISKITYMLPVLPAHQEYHRVPQHSMGVLDIMRAAGWPTAAPNGGQPDAKISQLQRIETQLLKSLPRFDEFNFLEDTYWITPPKNLASVHYNFSNGATKLFTDQSVWKITYSRGGYFMGLVSSVQYAKGESQNAPLPRRMFGSVTPSGDVKIVMIPADFSHMEEQSQVTYATGKLIRLPSATTSANWHDMEPRIQKAHVFELRMHSFVGRGSSIFKVTFMVSIAPGDSEWNRVPGTKESTVQIMNGAGWPVGLFRDAELEAVDEERSKLMHAYFSRLQSFDQFNDLEGKYFCYPQSSLSALQMDFADGETAIYKVQTVWKITFCKGGYLFGEVSTVAYEEGDEEPSPVALRIFGTIAPSGQVSLFCIPISFEASHGVQMTTIVGYITPRSSKIGSTSGSDRWQLILQMQSYGGSGNKTIWKLAVVSQVTAEDKDWHQLPGVGLGVREMREQAGWNVVDS